MSNLRKTPPLQVDKLELSLMENIRSIIEVDCKYNDYANVQTIFKKLISKGENITEEMLQDILVQLVEAGKLESPNRRLESGKLIVTEVKLV